MPCVGRCAIYDRRPTFCQEYPKPGDFLPPTCTFHFQGPERRGTCKPDACLEDNCCNYPREGGEPTAKARDELAGGQPCKHLRWVEEAEPKVADSDDEAPSITGEIYDAMIRAMEGEDLVR